MFVVYDVQSIRILKHIKTEGAAKRSMAAFTKKGRAVAYCTQEVYDNHINVMTTTYSMMDPERKPIAIRMADKGGCCDPATETYWSM